MVEVRKDATTRELVFAAVQMIQSLTGNIEHMREELKAINGRGRTATEQQAVQRAEFEACREYHDLLMGRRGGNGARGKINENPGIIAGLVGVIVVLAEIVRFVV